jgi:CubicO group peptidase (beta-lactamase class C family)
MKKIFLIIIGIIFAITLLLTTNTFSHIRNFALWKKHTIHDWKTHPTQIVKAAQKPDFWLTDSTYNKKQIPDSLLKKIESRNTVAFLVIQDNKIKYERYWNGYGKDTLSGSFSAAKSIISLLIGIAIDEKKIQSVNQKVADILPEFLEDGKEKTTIRDLLTMSSGTNWQERDKSYFSLNARAYYGDDVEEVVNDFKQVEPAGKFWDYRSGDTQVLGLILEKIYKKSIPELTSEKLFQPMGAETDALWLLDGDKKHAKAFCCFNGIARDYARFGKLLLQDGSWNGKQLVSQNYIKEATQPAKHLQDRTENNAAVDYYGYQFWILNHRGMTIPSMNGLFGQYVYVLKDKRTIIVRLGESAPEKYKHHFQPENFDYVDAGLSVID